MTNHYVICHWLTKGGGPAFICTEYGTARVFESEQSALEYISGTLIRPGDDVMVWSVALLTEVVNRDGERGWAP